MLLLAMVPSLFAESHKYGSHKKALAVQQVQVFKQDTDLIKAVKTGNIKAVKQLLKNKNVDLNQLDTDNKTALDLAVEYQRKKIVFLLAKAGGKVTSMDKAEAVHEIIVHSSSNISTGVFSSMSYVIFGLAVIVAAGAVALGIFILGYMLMSMTQSGVPLLAGLILGSFVCIALFAHGGHMLWSSTDCLRGIKENSFAELYIKY